MTRRDPTPRPAEPPGVRVYVLVVAAIAFSGVAGSWVLVGPPNDLVALATLLVLGFISVGVQERDVGSKVSLSFLSIVVIASIVLTGPVGSALIGALPVM
ncbi:MAG TPA: hypothetical protein VI110_05525, partial [Lapillicoccus sp.]